MTDPVEVALRVPGRLVLDMYGKFGHDLLIYVGNTVGGHFIVKRSIKPFPELFGWCARCGGGVEILAPQNVRIEFAMFIVAAQKRFSMQELNIALNKLPDK